MGRDSITFRIPPNDNNSFVEALFVVGQMVDRHSDYLKYLIKRVEDLENTVNSMRETKQ